MTTKTTEKSDLHPVQNRHINQREGTYVPESVALAAYEVYRELHGPQQAMVSGGCRGGFAISEYFAFLYARGFPKDEWRARVDECLRGAVNL